MGELAAADGGVRRVPVQARACNKSAPHAALLRDALLLLGAAARRGGNAVADGVFSAADAGHSLAAVLAAVTLQFREHEVPALLPFPA